MINKFLRAKHWQIFLLIFVLPFILQIIFILRMVFFITQSGGEPEPGSIITSMLFLGIALLLATAIYFGWFWSIGVGLQQSVPAHVRLPVRSFKFFLLSQIVCVVLMMILFVPFILTSGQHGPTILLIVIPLQLFCVFCIFYCMRFIAKTIKTAELQRPVSYGDYIGEFFLIWFYFIGVWILQPRVNKLVTQQREQDPDSIFSF